jgi:hypothetical protein
VRHKYFALLAIFSSLLTRSYTPYEVSWDATCIPIPGIPEWKSCNRVATILVIIPADIKVCPLRNRAGSVNAGCIDAKEVGHIEGCVISDTTKNDEEHHGDGSSEEEPRRKGQKAACYSQMLVAC